jgi:hypothetical protein
MDQIKSCAQAPGGKHEALPSKVWVISPLQELSRKEGLEAPMENGEIFPVKLQSSPVSCVLCLYPAFLF